MNLTAIALAMGVAVSTTAVHAQSLSLTLSGGNPGGLWSLLGAVVLNLIITVNHRRDRYIARS